ncbi:MAG TPA: Gfo/Idh/MocA family oxidoreductase [Candidatus Aminicenantes bacterium]|nr:Gfo/Idh/MocA family oxidoreductase [Candidatus Aminicenantes bacterium]
MGRATKTPAAGRISRRDFLRSSATAGLGAALAGRGLGQDPPQAPPPAKPAAAKRADEIRVAVIGCGAQGRVLIESMLRIPSVRIAAICDIWSYSRQYAGNYVKRYGHEATAYEDYRDLLASEKGLHAAIVATPDWVHAEHTKACLRAGLPVYCEKEMANTLEEARSMVLAARTTGKLLQIGHQRRSNPRYIHAIDRLIRDERLLGRVTVAYAQWNRAKADLLGWPERYAIDQATLEKYGYRSMTEFRNWRLYKRYGGGPMVDLGSHQIDLFGWVHGTTPKSVVASGGLDYYDNWEWYDNVMAVYEFETKEGASRAFYQVQTTTQHGGFYETFMGENGSLVLSEIPERGNWAMREPHAPEWDSLAKAGLLQSETLPIQKSTTKNIYVDVRVTAEAGRWPLPVELAKPAHQPHLENFFAAVRDGVPLNCPAELAYESCVAVLKANEAVKARRVMEFRPEQFKA